MLSSKPKWLLRQYNNALLLFNCFNCWLPKRVMIWLCVELYCMALRRVVQNGKARNTMGWCGVVSAISQKMFVETEQIGENRRNRKSWHSRNLHVGRDPSPGKITENFFFCRVIEKFNSHFFEADSFLSDAISLKRLQRRHRRRRCSMRRRRWRRWGRRCWCRRHGRIFLLPIIQF